MALKRLDEEFDLKPGTQLLPYMDRLLPSLEGRFQALETERKTFEDTLNDVRGVALARINEMLIPATEAILEVTQLGFLLGPSSSSVLLEIGQKTFTITEGPQRDSFTPSPYVIVERQANITDYAIARVNSYNRENGALSLNITAAHGNPGPHTDWVISSTPGMADSTKLYHDAVGPLHDQVVIDAAQVAADKIEIQAAIEALEAAGLDVNAFIRRDGTVPFIALQRGVAPPTGSSDTTIPTTSWVRARLIEYAGEALLKTGGTMSGPLYLSGAPTQPLQAATKQYVDAIIGAGGIVNGMLTINAVNPTLRLQATGTGQNRMIEARSSGGAPRWVQTLGDTAAESGGDVGSNYVLHRYNDAGAYIGQALHIARATGVMTVPGGLQANGGLNVVGDIGAYRPGSPTTGAIFINQARSAHWYWDGVTHQFGGGGISTGASPITGGHISSYSLYTNGHPITTWGLTSHGNITVNGTVYTQAIQVGSTGPMITMYDSDWGNMYIHHQAGNIGFLNNGAGWVWHVTNAGHVYSAAYGWMHDYINTTASNQAWGAANHRYNEALGQMVTALRWVHAADLNWREGAMGDVLAQVEHAALTGLYVYYSATGGRWRQLQHHVNGNWYTSGWAS